MFSDPAFEPTPIRAVPPVPWLAAAGGPSRPTGVAPLVDLSARSNLHDRASWDVLLARVAALLDVPALRAEDAGAATLRIPAATIDTAAARAAGIAAREHLLGGIVPATFVGTKAIAHPLIAPAADRPPLWSEAMATELGDAALGGVTAFSHADAALGGRMMLARGPVRIKDVCGKAGLGQTVVRDAAELDAVLAGEEAAALAEHGIVIEENLIDVVTYSVGCVELGGRSIGYWGSQSLTRDRKGREVYGGTDLYAVRGGFDALVACDLPPTIARAVAYAIAFDRAAHLAWPALVLTRRNYDVIEGVDAAGARRIGVLEQSWRVGGASGAEIAAFEALRDDPAVHAVRCSTVELYDLVEPPTGATVYFRGIDPVVGPMTKYAMRLV